MTRRLQWLAFTAMAIVLVIVFWYSQKTRDDFANREIIRPEPEIILPDVSVVSVSTDKYQASISAFGAANPRFNVTLSAQVTGQVQSLSPSFDNGLRVKQGSTLASLENSDYQAAVTQAQQQLAEAELLFVQEQRQGQQAAIEWQSSGLSGDPDALVLRQPQLAQTQAAVNNAKAQLRSAEKDLQFTHIKAPFDALIVSRDVSPGSFVQAGAQVATLYSTDRVEISVSLSDREWQSLPAIEEMQAKQWPVLLEAVEGNGQWQGFVLRSEQHLNETTRQRALIISVENPLDQQPILNPGTFVKATLSGIEQSGLWQLPLTSLSQRGDIWYVNEQNQLAKFPSTPIFSNADAIFIRPPEKLSNETQRVLIQPIDSYLAGMQVLPVDVNTDE
ncbi:efflux RND transporter periplasmic adaptor subunit [Methylophaga sp. OBS3]|uniref:efflux RND transporter periplasmic adaptor subunit n=1 Tax=Methylophaga sp. OBS3 TaxID=2991934 RepID=UPI00225BE9A0|nr:efflux RND transporter periplasmic adaptor subunit [Methylophaga sp. OBS3]MCX4190083.1 efflux RND transporter periplasmic adaptor subunit [Methylophaga sp. OBS3]